MPYTALPDRRMPYDNDGTIVGWNLINTSLADVCVAQGIEAWLSSGDMIEFNDDDHVALSVSIAPGWGGPDPAATIWWFFPESREVTAFHVAIADLDENLCSVGTSPATGRYPRLHWIQGSSDTTNGVDGTWETASLPSGATVGFRGKALDLWRSSIAAISFTGGKKVIRQTFIVTGSTGQGSKPIVLDHLYGEKVAGQTPDDIIFIDHDTTPGVEYTAPEDFGDQPLGTTVVRQFRLKNTSSTKSANTINIQCNDSDFAISTDGNTWVVTINITSLAAGAESSTMYVRCTTPAVGALLGPRFSRIVVTVASYT